MRLLSQPEIEKIDIIIVLLVALTIFEKKVFLGQVKC